jgi:hypothetical protein
VNSPAPAGHRDSDGIRLFTGIVIAIALLVGVGVFFWMTATPAGTTEPAASRSNTPAVAAATEDPVESSEPWFRDVTADSGIHFICRNGEEADRLTILESLGCGVALIDYDGDGLLDVFLVGGGYFDGPDKKTIRGAACRLFRNLGGFRFQDVTKEAGFDIPWWYTHGAAVADYDRDGWPDLLVTGYGRIALFHNEPDGKGGRKFVDVSDKVGLHDDAWCTGAGWADLDGDGFPDLYVCHYTDWSFQNHAVCVGQVPGVAHDICPPTRFKPQPHSIYKNVGGQKFVDATADFGVKATGYGLGVLTADLNGDGRPDVYVTNDMSPNFLFWNRGGKLEEGAVLAGVAVDDSGRATASMGVDAADIDGSGRPSLMVTNFQRELHSLYRNLGKEAFLYHSWAGGLAALGRSYVGWGTGFVDVDNDGWEDLVVVNGHLYRHPEGTSVKQPTLLLHSVERQGLRLFANVSKEAGPPFRTPAVGRGLAIGDLDNDGWPDLVVTNTNSPATILRNERGKVGNNWLGVRLEGKGHRDVVGSTVVLDNRPQPLTRFAKGGGSYLSASDSRILFGLGHSDQPRRVTVKWSWGGTQTWNDLRPGRYYQLIEGEPVAKPIAQPEGDRRD